MQTGVSNPQTTIWLRSYSRIGVAFVESRMEETVNISNRAPASSRDAIGQTTPPGPSLFSVVVRMGTRVARAAWISAERVDTPHFVNCGCLLLERIHDEHQRMIGAAEAWLWLQRRGLLERWVFGPMTFMGKTQ
jgi:hypothetical protein